MIPCAVIQELLKLFLHKREVQSPLPHPGKSLIQLIRAHILRRIHTAPRILEKMAGIKDSAFYTLVHSGLRVRRQRAEYVGL
jgi:hypothetical protein